VSEPLLEVRDLRVSFRTENGIVRAVDGVSFALEAGHVLGIVGESGSGKSVTVMSIMQLIRDPNAIFEGQVLYKGRDLMGLSQTQMQSVRGAEIAMIFQDPMTSLNPVYKIGWQIEEMLRAHERLTRRAAHARAVDLLSSVGIPSAARRVDDYPHQFSGGMRQRVMIAMALACNPDLLIADEPTTALDVTIQAQILALIDRLKVEYGSAVIVITHDMGVVAQVAETVAVMYAGRIVEQGGVDAVFGRPQHPYTWGLLGSIPRLDRPKPGRLPTIRGLPPSLIDLPAGCAFAPRCDYVFNACRQRPDLAARSESGHLDRCFLDPEARAALRMAASEDGAA
jgi:oligopeptide/dipeptide ABC transporter ATP-binding protein